MILRYVQMVFCAVGFVFTWFYLGAAFSHGTWDAMQWSIDARAMLFVFGTLVCIPVSIIFCAMSEKVRRERENNS